MNKDLFRIATTNIRQQGRRTWLTMIGIFIGIAAVVALISLGQGLEDSIQDQFDAIGADKLFIQSRANTFGTSGADISNPLTIDDLEVVRDTRGVQEASYYNVRSARIEVGEDVGFYFVGGIDTGEYYDLIREFITVDITDGRELRSGDANNVLVGFDYTKESVFLEPVSVGERITVNEKKFTVVGILEPIGNAADDRSVFMPVETMNELFDIEDTTDIIIARVSPGENPTLVGEEVTRALLNERDLDEEDRDFSVQTPEDLLASFGTILTIIQVVLTGIAGISLLVGAVNITNTMYTSVLERTKEIGIMKAIGATPRTIQLLFLIESALLGLAGGVIGAVIGALMAKGVEFAAQAAMGTDLLRATISIELMLGAILFSGVIGMVSGYLPARGAANQDAVESLRYE
jgi:putative ABC transport system permease protein